MTIGRRNLLTSAGSALLASLLLPLRAAAAVPRVRITGIELRPVRATSRTVWLFVRLLTDTSLVGLGEACDFGGVAEPNTSVLATSRVWESFTPFVPTRHPKRVRGVEVDTIPEQIARACKQLLDATPVSVTPLGDEAAWQRFRRRRNDGGGRRGPDRAYGARIVFDRPVPGPIAIGYGAHFGLGVFVPGSEDLPG